MDPVLLALLKKHIDVPGLANDVIDQVLQPALQNIVNQSPTKLDDIAMAALYPLLEVEVKKQIALLWAGLGVSSPSVPSQPPGNPV